MPRLYFGQPINVFGTGLQRDLLARIAAEFPGCDIENPDAPRHADGYARWKSSTGNGMSYYEKEVLPACDGGIFLPFRDGRWGFGVWTEAMFFADRDLPTFMILPTGEILDVKVKEIVPLSIEETRARIRLPDGGIVPYDHDAP